MNREQIVKGSLNAIAMTLIGAGATMLMARDVYGLLLVVVGVTLTYGRELLKPRLK